MENQVWAVHRLKSKSGNVEQKFRLIVKAYDKSKNYLQTMEIQQDRPLVSHLKGELDEFVSTLNDCMMKGFIPSDLRQNDVEEVKKILSSMNVRNINDCLTKDEFETLLYAMDDISRELKRILNIDN